jgi:SAM-dependent methyltransferase
MAKKIITINELLRLGLVLGKSGRALDVGCGGKIYETYIECSNYIGIDVMQSGHDKSDIKADLFFDGLNIPFKDDSFDLVICTEVLEHAIDPLHLLSEMKRVLMPFSGRIIVTVPSMWGEHETPYDFRRYTSFGIKRIFTDAGLEIVNYQKESPGISAFIKLGLSEISNSENSPIKKYLSMITLKMADIFMRRILRARMDRIYLTNLIVGSKK